MKISGSFDVGGVGTWHFLPLLDIYSILAAENNHEEVETVPESRDRSKRSSLDYSRDRLTTPEKSHGDGASPSHPSSGFFSITASTGEVHVFEAPTGGKRDYVVRGLRTVLSRLSYHICAGNVEVCAQLYSEDAGQLTGELPSLLTPNQALSRLTHAFIDAQ